MPKSTSMNQSPSTRLAKRWDDASTVGVAVNCESVVQTLTIVSNEKESRPWALCHRGATDIWTSTVGCPLFQCNDYRSQTERTLVFLWWNRYMLVTRHRTNLPTAKRSSQDWFSWTESGSLFTGQRWISYGRRTLWDIPKETEWGSLKTLSPSVGDVRWWFLFCCVG